MKSRYNARKILAAYAISSFVWAILLMLGGPLIDMQDTLKQKGLSFLVNMILSCIGEGLLSGAIGVAVGTLLFSAALSIFHSLLLSKSIASSIALVVSVILGFHAGMQIPEAWQGDDIFLQLRLAAEAGITGYVFAWIGLLNNTRSTQPANGELEK